MKNNISVFTAALSYAEKGWMLFPAPPGSKKSHVSKKYDPNERNWGMTNDPEQIKQYWQDFPAANVGLPTGSENGFWVCEADTIKGHGVDGIGSLRALEEKHGPLPPTLMAESPSGSLHHYFKLPNDVGIAQRVQRPQEKINHALVFGSQKQGTGNPRATTLSQIIEKSGPSLGGWLRDRRNRRQIPFRFEQCGYVAVRNPAEKRDGSWKIAGVRQVIYAQRDLSLRDQLAAAMDLMRQQPRRKQEDLL